MEHTDLYSCKQRPLMASVGNVSAQFLLKRQYSGQLCFEVHLLYISKTVRSFYSFSSTSQRELLLVLLHYIYFGISVTLQIQIISTTYYY